MQTFHQNNRYDVLTPSGWADFKGVFQNHDSRPGKRLELENGVAITATLDHRFFNEVGAEISCDLINVGAIIQYKETNASEIKPVRVISVEKITLDTSYDIFDADGHVILVNGGALSHQCDEFSFLPPNIASDFWTSLAPTLSTGGKIIITSTPNTDEDQFAKIWFEANNTIDADGNESDVGKNGFKSYLATWERHPDRDQAWADAEIANIGEEQFRREHNCVTPDTEVTVRHPDGSVETIAVGTLYDRLKFHHQINTLRTGETPR